MKLSAGTTSYKEMAGRDTTVSVVSHGQNRLVNLLLEDIQRSCADRVHLVLTENVPDPVALSPDRLSCPVERIMNDRVKGFGANHNAAFKRCRTPYFCVVNPDVRLPGDPLAQLAPHLEDASVGVVGPLVRGATGDVEDSARRFPSLGRLLARSLGRSSGPDYPTDRGVVQADWLAGMFLLFRAETYRSIGGFDESYFLYYEDVDICKRLGKSGMKVIYETRAEVIHDARRGSRRDARLAKHHIASMLRFLTRRG